MYEAWFKHLVGVVGGLVSFLFLVIGSYFLFVISAHKRELDGHKSWQDKQDDDIKSNSEKINTHIGECKGYRARRGE